MIATVDPLTAARAAALFVSDMSAKAHPTRPEVATVIRNSVRTHGGSRGCAADVAAAYGDCPELAARRMRWARKVIEDLYRRREPDHPPSRPRPTGPDRAPIPAPMDVCMINGRTSRHAPSRSAGCANGFAMVMGLGDAVW
jgi:hypothetical protein